MRSKAAIVRSMFILVENGRRLDGRHRKFAPVEYRALAAHFNRSRGEMQFNTRFR
jgi:hypothetical protein